MKYGKGLDPKRGIESCEKLIENGGACNYEKNYVNCYDCPGAGGSVCVRNGWRWNYTDETCDTCVQNAKAYIAHHTGKTEPKSEPINPYMTRQFEQMREVAKEKLRKMIRENEPIDRTIVGEYEFLCRMIEALK